MIFVTVKRCNFFFCTCEGHKETGAITDWNNVLYTMLVLELCVILHIFMDAVYSATIMVATALK